MRGPREVVELELAGIRVRALSIGGVETYIELPAYKLAFDVGRCPPEAVVRRTLLFTHAHVDHLGGIAYHAATRALQNMPPPTYVLPRGNVDDVAALFATWRRLDGSEMPCELVGIAPGEEHALNPRVFARAFRSIHTVDTLGYVVWEKSRKLKPDYRGLPQAELRRLRVEEKVEITREERRPMVAFCGDTRIEVIEREPDLRRARLLILEATFLDERVSPAEARAKGHVHLDEIAERADLFENEALLLTHFSARYSRAEIERLVATRLPAALAGRTRPLLAGFR